MKKQTKARAYFHWSAHGSDVCTYVALSSENSGDEDEVMFMSMFDMSIRRKRFGVVADILTVIHGV